MDIDYRAAYEKLWKYHWWWRSRRVFILRHINKILAGQVTSSILDVGCGPALFFSDLERYGDVWGIEPGVSKKDIVEEYRKRVYTGLLDENYAPPGKFDLILLLDVIEHVDMDADLLFRSANLLSSGGVLMITVPAMPCLWTSHDAKNQHYRRYSLNMLNEACARSGCEVLESFYLYHWLALVKLAVVLKEKLVCSTLRPPAIPHPLVNHFLERLSTVEQRIFNKRHLPFGSSLFALARPILP